MPKGFSETEKNVIRSRLMEEARKVFALNGLRKTSVEELTHSVGISKGAFYLFYESKEQLFFDVLEEAELQFRRVVLARIDDDFPDPAEGLQAVLKTAFTIWKTSPVLGTVGKADYELLLRRLTPEKIQEHLESDRSFLADFAGHWEARWGPLRVSIEQLSGLMNALFFVSLHEDDFGADTYAGTIGLLIEIISGYCIGKG